MAPSLPFVHHRTLKTTFVGIDHPLSRPDLPVAHFRGIKYASIPMRFRPSLLLSSYGSKVDATHYGPICPQPLRGIAGLDAAPHSADAEDLQLKQDEFECLNLNITCPGDARSRTRLPVMLWIHGGDCGSGSSWLYDGGSLVQKSIMIGKPIILVTINYRLGIFGSVASLALQEDNVSAGFEGVGNYGLRDQQTALEWIHRFISEFGGNPENVTLFGEGTGASDVLCHFYSSGHATHGHFHRAIAQSPIGSIEHDALCISAAGRLLAKTMSRLRVSTLAELRAVDAGALAALPMRRHSPRATDDGVFFRPGWKDTKADGEFPKQPLIIGDSSLSALSCAPAASLWSVTSLAKRARAVCQSATRASTLLRAYDLCSLPPSHCTSGYGSTDENGVPQPPELDLDDDLPERVMDLVLDARWAWPAECAARRRGFGHTGQKSVFRYVWDQDTPLDCAAAADGALVASPDLAYLFDNVPAPEDIVGDSPFDSAVFDDDDDEFDGPAPAPADERSLPCSPASSRSASLASITSFASSWASIAAPRVDRYAFTRVRDAVQERWIAFAAGERPWAADRVWVFGPEGECGERSMGVFEARRRVKVWRDALHPLGMEMVAKAGAEIAEGPCL